MLKALRFRLIISKKKLSEKCKRTKHFGQRKFYDLRNKIRGTIVVPPPQKTDHENILQVQALKSIQENVFVTQQKLQEYQDVLQKNRSSDDNYITLETKVQNLLNEQKFLRETFSCYVQNEKEQQAALISAISHKLKHEQTDLKRKKFLWPGVIGGVFCLMGIIICQISSELEQLKSVVASQGELVSQVEKKLSWF